jgi:hypothetical protein
VSELARIEASKELRMVILLTKDPREEAVGASSRLALVFWGDGGGISPTSSLTKDGVLATVLTLKRELVGVVLG